MAFRFVVFVYYEDEGVTMAQHRLISSTEAVEAPQQHTAVCSDCPWSRKSLPGWLGGEPADTWIKEAHSDSLVPCHVISNQQCAGIAIYRANVCKTPRYPGVLRLPANSTSVFSTPAEFIQHHQIERKSHERRRSKSSNR